MKIAKLAMITYILLMSRLRMLFSTGSMLSSTEVNIIATPSLIQFSRVRRNIGSFSVVIYKGKVHLIARSCLNRQSNGIGSTEFDIFLKYK